MKRMLTLLNLRMLQYNCALTVMVLYPVNIGKKIRTKMLLDILSTSDQPLLNLPDLEWFALAQKTFQHMGWDFSEAI